MSKLDCHTLHAKSLRNLLIKSLPKDFFKSDLKTSTFNQVSNHSWTKTKTIIKMFVKYAYNLSQARMIRCTNDVLSVTIPITTAIIVKKVCFRSQINSVKTHWQLQNHWITWLWFHQRWFVCFISLQNWCYTEIKTSHFFRSFVTLRRAQDML